MGKIYDLIDEKLARWLDAQKIFFVATAPLSPNGHINCSPKDGASFRILDEQTVAYLDLTGSGVETIAHLKENRRIVLMFCAVTGRHLIPGTRNQNLTQGRKGAKRRGIVSLSLNLSVCPKL